MTSGKLLTTQEIAQACKQLRALLECGEEGEFTIDQKVWVQVFNEAPKP